MGEHIGKHAQVRTDGWTGYKGLESEFPKLTREKSEKKGKNFPQLHRSIMMFKAWLRGVHHSVHYRAAAACKLMLTSIPTGSTVTK